MSNLHDNNELKKLLTDFLNITFNDFYLCSYYEGPVLMGDCLLDTRKDETELIDNDKIIKWILDGFQQMGATVCNVAKNENDFAYGITLYTQIGKMTIRPFDNYIIRLKDIKDEKEKTDGR